MEGPARVQQPTPDLKFRARQELTRDPGTSVHDPSSRIHDPSSRIHEDSGSLKILITHPGTWPSLNASITHFVFSDTTYSPQIAGLVWLAAHLDVYLPFVQVRYCDVAWPAPGAHGSCGLGASWRGREAWCWWFQRSGEGMLKRRRDRGVAPLRFQVVGREWKSLATKLGTE